jgi:hypothetical protein
LVAATSGAVWWAIAGSVVTAAIMLWAFAPWIRGLQKLVPAFNRVQMAETAWSEGQALLMQHVTSDEQLKGWVQRLTERENRVGAWIREKVSPIDAGRFLHPKVIAHSLSGSVDPQHGRLRNNLSYQLEELIRIKGEQEQKLR